MIGRIAILVLIIWGCQTPSKKNNKASEELSTEATDSTSKRSSSIIESKEESHGVCRMLQEHKNSFKIYKPDSTLYKEYTFDESISKHKELQPFSMSYDYEVLVFTCYGKAGNYYKIKLNANDQDYKLIKKNDGFFVYEPWEKHILTVFAVEFDENTNPLREKNAETSKKMQYHSDADFLPVRVSDNWLQVKWGDEVSGYKYGWIKWRDATTNLLVQLFYAA
jgi:hypothetical protein